MMPTSRSIVRAASLAAVFHFAACQGESTGPSGEPATSSAAEDPAIVTEATDVVLRSGSTVVSGVISFHFTNRSERAVSIPNCNGTYPLILERPRGERWVKALSGEMLMGCMSPP